MELGLSHEIGFTKIEKSYLKRFFDLSELDITKDIDRDLQEILNNPDILVEYYEFHMLGDVPRKKLGICYLLEEVKFSLSERNS